jgi:hypothetical protein
MVFEKYALRRPFGPERVEVVWDCRNINSEEASYRGYCSSNVFKASISRKTKYVGCIWERGAKENVWSCGIPNNKGMEGITGFICLIVCTLQLKVVLCWCYYTKKENKKKKRMFMAFGKEV